MSYLRGGITGTRYKSSHVGRDGQTHDIASMACERGGLLARFDVPKRAGDEKKRTKIRYDIVGPTQNRLHPKQHCGFRMDKREYNRRKKSKYHGLLDKNTVSMSHRTLTTTKEPKL